MHRGLFNSKLLDSINFAALYLVPLLVMTVSVSLFLSPTPPYIGRREGVYHLYAVDLLTFVCGMAVLLSQTSHKMRGRLWYFNYS